MGAEMTWDYPNGRPPETVQAEIRAIESREHSGADPAVLAHVDHLRREHAEARRARRRELEDELLTIPRGAPHGSAAS